MPTAARPRGAAWRALCATILERDRHVCQLRITGICTTHATCVDHTIPVSLAPELAWAPSNLRAACRPCNTRKSNLITGWRPDDDEPDPYAI